MRRHQREGFSKGDVQRRVHEVFWTGQKLRGQDERGWNIPGPVSQGFAELAGAAWHRFYRLWLLRDHLTGYERKDYLRRARLNLKYARQCDRPRLP